MLQRTFKNKTTSKLLSLEREENEASGVILWMTIMAMVLGVAGALLSLLALRPIRRLAEAARRISRGDFSYTVEVRTSDEFGFLAQEFNRMAKSLALREEERARHQVQLEKINRELRQSGIDLSLMKLYNENIIRSIHNAIVVADSLGVVTTLNPSAVSLFTLDPEKTIGQRILELPIAKRLTHLGDDWRRVLLSKERIVFEAVEYDTSEGATLLVDIYICPLLGHDGNVQGVLFVGEDVSEKVRTKQALIQSERMATIGRMSALVAHEIRNPLSSIGLNAEMLQDEMGEHLPEECRGEVNQLLGSISREVERLAEVTEEYLKFARLPKPQLVPERLNELVEGLLRFVEEEYRQAKIEIQVKLDPAIDSVRADEGQLRQAFLNLLRNALEAMPQGGVLSITTEALGERARISVSDTGCGMEKDVLERVFDPFFSTKDSGTGLGLSLTQHIIHEHGGSIFCQSLPQKGSTFVVELPLESQSRRNA